MPEEAILPYARLHFNINVPSVEETWLDGFECAQKNMEEEDNPFPENSTEHRYWSDGWWAGFYDEEPLFSLTDETNPAAVKTQAAPLHLSKTDLILYHWNDLKNKSWYVRLWQICSIFLASVVVYEIIGFIAEL